ncbi:MAG TPA: hypothetical protein VFB79_03045 [Candidatus Angelobacter sp.]|nr:hypothetical protein [Candidatus Angelobacter sp.]
MKTENYSRMGSQVKNVAEFAERARDLSAKVKERLDATYNDFGRSMQRAKTAAEDRIEDVRDQVRSRPLASVAAVAGVAFGIGIVTGWLLGRNTRSES